MKELIGFLFFFCITAIVILLIVQKQLGAPAAATLLAFGLGGGFVIARFDWIKTLEASKDGIKLETFKQEVSAIKETAIAEIKDQVNEQKNSLKLVISDANTTREKLETIKKEVEELFKKTTALEKSVKEQQEAQLATAARTEAAEQRARELTRISNDLALTMTKIAWLQIETRSEFGGARVEASIQAVTNDLNRILPVVIPDANARQRWIDDLQRILPPR